MPQIRPIALSVLVAFVAAVSVARGEEPAPGSSPTPPGDRDETRSSDGGYSQGSFSLGAGVAVAGGTDGAWGAGLSPSLRLQGVDVGGPGIAVIVDLHGRAIAGGLSGEGEPFGGGTGGLDFSIGYVTARQGCGLRIGGGTSIELGQFGSEDGTPVLTADSIDLVRFEPGLLCHGDATTFFLTPYAGIGMSVMSGYSMNFVAGAESRLWVSDRISAHVAAGAVVPLRTTDDGDGVGEGPRVQGDVGVDVRVAERVFGGTSDLTVGVSAQGQAPVGGSGGAAGFMGAASAGFTF